MINLSNKIAVVAGGNGGIGSVIVKQFLALDAKLAVLDVKETETQSDNLLSITVDATKEQDLVDARNQIIEKWGKVDILVNAIGAPAASGKTEELSLEDWRKVVDTDITSAFLLSKVFGKEMVKNKYGRIVHFASFHTVATYPNRAAYNTAKSGVKGLTRALAVEWGCYGITVNAVAPGPIITPRTSWFLSQSPDVESGMIGRTPNTRLGKPEDVANLVAFLASDKALHINGQQIVIDGGWTKCAWWGKHEKKY